MTTTERPRRRRRLASDEAHSWARSLRLDNPYAKSVLLALTLYVNDEASCFVSIGQVAEDTDLSDDTVRKRLKFLEDVGAIVRFPRWRDESGRANTEGRGKRTTDDIRLLIDADPEEIEARARGETSPESDEISPRSQQGLNPEAENLSPAPALGQPSHCSEGLTSEPEPEPSPQPPSGGEGLSISNEEKPEPEHFAEFWTGYPGYRVMDRGRALQVFSAMTEPERALARAAAPLLTEDLAKLKRRPKDAYKWLRDRGFDQYPHAKLTLSRIEPVWIDEGPDIDALRVLAVIADRAPPRLIHDEIKGSGLPRNAAVAPDLQSLSKFAGQDLLDWSVVEPDTREYNAWRHRLHEWTGQWIEARIVMRRGVKLMQMLPGQPALEVQNRQRGIPVPCRWPPKKDGTIYSETSEGNAA